MNSFKIKNIKGLQRKEYFSNCNLSRVSTEGRLIAVNEKYFAFSLKKAGDIIIVDSSKPGYIKDIQPHIKGINENILDLEFSPFNNNILSSSYQNSILLWEIPENGLEHHLTKEILTYNEHKGKVHFINFNPIKEDIIVSADYNKEIHVWNILNGKNNFKLEIENIPTLVSWSPNGNLIGVTSKDKYMNIFESRTNKIICKQKITDFRFNPKFAWIDNNLFVTTNETNHSNQELKLWDIRKLNNNSSSQSEITSIQIDNPKNRTNISIPFVNNELKLVYTTAKGDRYINIYDYSEGIFKKQFDFQSSENAVSSIIFNRKKLDKNINEVDRFARYSYNKKIYYVSFIQGNISDDIIYIPSTDLKNCYNNKILSPQIAGKIGNIGQIQETDYFKRKFNQKIQSNRNKQFNNIKQIIQMIKIEKEIVHLNL